MFDLISIEKLGQPEFDGDWHDKPLRYVVFGPNQELQKFSTKKNAIKYRSIRARTGSLNEATREYCRLP